MVFILTMHHIIAAASKAELQDAFWTGSGQLLAGFAAIVFAAVVLAHIFRD